MSYLGANIPFMHNLAMFANRGRTLLAQKLMVSEGSTNKRVETLESGVLGLKD